jgi:hypothetical protein
MSSQRRIPTTNPVKDPVPFVQRLGGLQSLSGRVRKISSLPPEFDPRIVQPVASRYTDWAIPARTVFIVYQYYRRYLWYVSVQAYHLRGEQNGGFKTKYQPYDVPYIYMSASSTEVSISYIVHVRVFRKGPLEKEVTALLHFFSDFLLWARCITTYEQGGGREHHGRNHKISCYFV